MKYLRIKNLSYIQNSNYLIKNICFDLKKGEILSVVGPSGAGKSTLLRLLAGFIKPTKGEIILSKNIISDKNNIVPTGDRNIGLLFQEEVLFPHLTVYKNIGFGLKKTKTENKKLLIEDYLERFGLTNRKNFYPENLSGGEKQRVSLARTLITNPKILLMDEPFSSLDNKLRCDILNYTMGILKEKNISVIFVTHDIREALKVSDRLMVLKEGRLVQLETPEKIYKNPKSKFVAKLFGEVNELTEFSNNLGEIKTPFGIVNCKKASIEKKECLNKKHAYIIRPEDICLKEDALEGIKGIIKDKHFLGSGWEYDIFLEREKKMVKASQCKESFRINQNVRITIKLENILIFKE